ncbi:MAG: hypothetical protein LBI82_07260 [Dysgonamonadaceae bacterium]|jgi:hypothetical protein|nr:hypothetical protein [Dysgonamonadaceae bacterium]
MKKKTFRIIETGFSANQLSEMELDSLTGGGCLVQICGVKACGVNEVVVNRSEDTLYLPFDSDPYATLGGEYK